MRKSVGDYSGTPYVTTLLNCFLWVFYGSSAVTNTTLIISINGAGLALEAIYISIHLFYGTDESRVQIYFFTISPTKNKNKISVSPN
jgi:solute carrier family 50 protein (sugar transporter)